MAINTKEDLYSVLIGTPVEEFVRIPQKLAKELLLNNCSMISNGCVFYFWIRNLGLGVCEVCLAPLGAKDTRMVK